MISKVDQNELSSCLGSSETALCLPPRAYTSKRFFTYEKENLFENCWLPIGRADRLQRIGDYETLDLCGHPLILIRGNENKISAFANSCRHRGARLLNGTGNTKGIRCPFHSWLYRIDGSLAAAPRMETSEVYLGRNNDLICYRLEEKLGFLFINFDENPEPFEDWLGNFSELHADWPITEMKTTRKWTREFPFNWKCFLDVFNEYYHLPFVHRDSIDAVYHTPREGDLSTGNFTTQFGKTDGTGGLLESQQSYAFGNMPGLTGDALTGARYTWIFPTMTFACSNDSMWVYEAFPKDESTCIVTQSTCFHPTTIGQDNFEEVSEIYYERMDTALDEDIIALSNQFIGLQSPKAMQGPFSPILEHNVANFAKWYSSRILDALEINNKGNL